jgi:UDP-N-acetyl-D-glucosamine dehydrogenase
LRRARAHVAVIGLGFAGLPLAMAFAAAGHRVTGIDIDASRVTDLNAGHSHIADVPHAELARHVATGGFVASTDYALLTTVDSVTICVPTPLLPGQVPDLRFIESAVNGLAPYLHAGMLVVLESTTYPGTTEEIVQSRVEARGLRTGIDVFIGFAPERIDPGSTSSPGLTVRSIPKLIGGATPACLAHVQALYEPVVDRLVPVSSLRTAEMAKLVENSFRMVNIAFANEVALMCDRLGINVWEVIDAAATKPYGFLAHYPGPGLGGHCIPVDPYYLSWKMKTLNVPARFIELAGEINRAMPAHVVGKVATALEARGKTIRGARVLVLGVTYKRDVADVRESPSLDILGLLAARGANVGYHDPHVPELEVAVQAAGSIDPHGPTVHLTCEDLVTSVRSADCVIVATDHTSYDWDVIAQDATLVVDTRNALARPVASGEARAAVVRL